MEKHCGRSFLSLLHPASSIMHGIEFVSLGCFTALLFLCRQTDHNDIILHSTEKLQ